VVYLWLLPSEFGHITFYGFYPQNLDISRSITAMLQNLSCSYFLVPLKPLDCDICVASSDTTTLGAAYATCIELCCSISLHAKLISSYMGSHLPVWLSYLVSFSFTLPADIYSDSESWFETQISWVINYLLFTIWFLSWLQNIALHKRKKMERDTVQIFQLRHASSRNVTQAHRFVFI